VAGLRRVVWWCFGAWLLFLLIVVISAQAHGAFGRDNLIRLEPGARQMGLWVCDIAESLGADFSSVREYLTNDLLTDALYYNGFVPQLIIVGIWALAGFLLAWIVTWILGIADRRSPMPRSVSLPSVSAGDPTTQRIMAVIIFVFLVIFFSPGWPAEGPVFRFLNDVMAEPARERQSAAITAELERQDQDWLPAELSPACRDILTENPDQAVAQTDPSRLRICGESVKSALEADATMGREPDPRTESASISFLLAISGLAQNGQLEGVGVADPQFREFERFARATYPDLRQEGWRQSAQRYLGLLQFPDDRANSQDARAETGYKLSVLAELLYNSHDQASLDMAYRIAAVTGSELSCVPDALRGAQNDEGTPVTVPDLPSCLTLVNAGAASADSSWIGLGSMATKALLGLLLLIGIAIPFVPWPGNFPYLILYIPLSALMVVSALG
jgi:hypothetical protein